MSDIEIEAKIIKAGLTAPRVLPQDINALFETLVYIPSQPEGSTSTFCHAYLPGKNGKMFSVATGHSACVSPENFNAKIGLEVAIGKAQAAAKDKLWELEGYALFKEMDRE